MRAVLLSIVALGLLACAAWPKTPDTFKYACAIVEANVPDASCKGIEPPIVVRTSLLIWLAQGTGKELYGLTPLSEPYVFVNIKLPKEITEDEVVIHETVHYILHRNKMFSKCFGEALARKAGDTFANREPDERWRKGYGCPALISK